MKDSQIEQLKQYLQTFKLPPNLTRTEEKYLLRESEKFTLYKGLLYRYNTENGLIRKALNKKEAEEVIYAYHKHPLGGHLAYNNTLHKIAARYYWDNDIWLQEQTKDVLSFG
ncbi:hypothetical protein G6F62_004284 [Rhizopus arrhizus]|nr:hypothetical protein G6F23_010768 [Rhizopus arrhizus]KAG1391690.1 hypothetical protein G6F58_012666 [Rhizopus delemar]KAG0768304.1 hypothetical protein G6F24_002061 [Rhizopus arrhizus]KAG0795006.1 hypothetical protein G6F21_002441 [Rhizopus arrhizus]KAG0827658.1 hypothetical protein G6F19_008675 [Rhizopus arrhizus]